MTPVPRFCLIPILLTPLALVPGCAVHVTDTWKPLPVAPENRPRHDAARPTAMPSAPTTSDEDFNDETDEQAWQAIRAALEKPGDLHDGILTFVFPRDDLEVTVLDNDTPVGAGIESDFRFYRCPCGKINVIGQFVVADYEANDVLDALRQGHAEIASVGPLLLHERPRLLLIRFQGENKRGGPLAKTVRAALTWTGKERMPPQKLDR